MEFRVLGPIEALAGGRPLALGGPKQRAVLGTLLLAANRVVSRDELVEAVWGDSPPPTAATALQVYVSRLRRALPEQRLVTRPAGYVLRVEAGELDAERFETARAAGSVREALAEWRGPPLEGAAAGGFARAEAHRLAELHASLLEERIEADLTAGSAAELIGELEALVARHPFRERLRGQLMLALYRSGRQAEALEEYRATRRTFDEELGIEPGVELRELHTAMLRQAPELEAARRSQAGVLFAVLAPAIAAGSDPEQVRKLLARALETATATLEQAGGIVERGLAGALLGRFESGAVDAALTLRERLETAFGGSVRARIGVEAGEVLAGPGATTGAPVATASRLAGSAEPGEILVGPEAARELPAGFEVERRGRGFRLSVPQ